MLQTASPTPASAVPMPDLYRRVERFIPPFEWTILADDVAAILRLKRERNAVVLAHNYQTPDIFHTVADIVGDSLALAREAVRTDAEVIVLAGVHFMAETAKLLNPEKTVLIPDLEAGCSLAASITAADIRLLRERHPVCRRHLATSAAVKAEPSLLHLGQRQEDHRGARGAAGDHAARRVPGEKHRGADQGRDHRLERPLRGARALHAGGHQEPAREPPRDHRSRPSRMPARGHRRMRFSGPTAAMADHAGGRLPVVLLTGVLMSDTVAPNILISNSCGLHPARMKRIRRRSGTASER